MNKLAKELLKPFIIGMIQICVFFTIQALPFSNFINLLIKGIVFVVTFIIGLVVTGQLKEMMKVIKK